MSWNPIKGVYRAYFHHPVLLGDTSSVLAGAGLAGGAAKLAEAATQTTGWLPFDAAMAGLGACAALALQAQFGAPSRVEKVLGRFLDQLPVLNSRREWRGVRKF
jgi:hypothetical protein